MRLFETIKETVTVGQAAEYYGRVVNEFSSSNVYKKSEEKLNNM